MALRTIEEITAEMSAISNLGDENPLTDEQVSRYEALETELKNVQRTEAIKTRNAAYNTVTYGAGVPARVARYDDKSDEYKGFVNYLRTGVGNADISHLRVSNAQGEGVSTAGGYLVPTEFRQKLIETRKAFGGFLPNAENINTTDGRPIEYPTNDDTANEGEITPEHSQFDGGADLVFGQVTLGAYKYTSLGASDEPMRVSVELMQDSAYDMEDLIARKLGQRIHRKQAKHAVIGTGVGEPPGVMASSLTADRSLDTDDTPDYEDLVEFQDLLDEEYDSNAKWLMKRSTWSSLRLMVDLNGRPLIQEANEGIQGLPVRRLLGHEVIIDEAVPAISTSADTHIIAYGDFREAYIWRRVGSLVVVVNPYSRAHYGEIEFTAWERADGAIQNRGAYKIMNNASAA
jgi:HK97 family phage major capsid protein